MKTLRPRPITIALAAWMMLAVTGCRTAGMGNLAKQPSLFPTRTNETAAELLVEHNRNASQVQSLEARPQIAYSDRIMAGGVGGRMSLERPRNFKLELTAVSGMTDVANIGSNDQEFWFWVKNAKEKAVYYCDYDENGESPLAGSLQPDWITEAFSLKVYTDAEMASMKVKPGIVQGFLVLSQTQKTPRGETVVKEIVLSEATHRIREHRVYSGDRKTLLAHATITAYLEAPLPSPPDDADAVVEKVFLPKSLKIEWMLEKLSLDILMSQIVVNPAIDDKTRALRFVEPSFKGYSRRNLAEREALARPGTSSPTTTIRETMPAPAPRVNLENPTPLGVNPANRTRRDAVALMADLPTPRPVEIEAVVGPTIPTVNEPRPGSLDGRPGWRNLIER